MIEQDERKGSVNEKLESFDSARYLVFTLCGEEYGMPLLKVKEVIGLTDITPMPYTPPYFRGIMNLRGQVISIIDLRLKFKMENVVTTPETTIIILNLAPLSLGVIVDSVESVLAVSASELKPAPEIESQISAEYINGVTKRDKKLVLLIDIEKILSVEDLRVIKNKTSEAA